MRSAHSGLIGVGRFHRKICCAASQSGVILRDGRYWFSTSSDTPKRGRGRPRKTDATVVGKADNLAQHVQSVGEPQHKPFKYFFDEVDEYIVKTAKKPIPFSDSVKWNGLKEDPSLIDLLDSLGTNLTSVSDSDTTTRSESGKMVHDPINQRKGSNIGNWDSLETKSTPLFGDSFGTHGKSLFDAFPVPPPQNPNAYDAKNWKEYKESIEQVVSSPRFKKNIKRQFQSMPEEDFNAVVDWLFLSEKSVDYSLPTLDKALQNEKSHQTTEDGCQEFTADLRHQQEVFTKATGLEGPQLELALRALAILGRQSAKASKNKSFLIGWEKIREAGLMPGSNILSTFLYGAGLATAGSLSGGTLGILSGTLSSLGGRSNGMSILDFLDDDKEKKVKSPMDEPAMDSKKAEVDIVEEIATFHDTLYKTTEQSVSLRVKALVQKGNASQAQNLLDNFSESNDGQNLKYRTYIPVLRLYCEQGDLTRAMILFDRMRKAPRVTMEPETYVQVIASIAEKGCFRPDALPLDGIKELGYSASSGPELFDLICAQMADDVLAITSASARRMHNALVSGFKDSDHPNAIHLKEIHALAPMPKFDELADDEELVVSRVTVDESTGKCPRTGATLRLLVLDQHQKAKLGNALLKMATEQYAKFMGGHRGVDPKFAKQQMLSFAELMKKRKGPPFTAIIDAPNVAYYMQNFDQGRFNFFQIQFVVNALKRMNEHPLIIIPSKYSSDSFYMTLWTGTGKHHTVTDEEKAIMEKWREEGILFVVPARCLDDYYWMLASFADQTNACKATGGVMVDVPTNDKSGRWPGKRPMVVTNDLMRDHQLELMEPRIFRRWRSCHIVNYNFTAFVNGESVDRGIGFSTPDFFSREIQANPSPTNSENRESKTECNTVWHFPVSDWETNDRFCVRIPRS
eukprot:CAMPEP_0198291006 /NCGR_PEP_ID=MMETSP1449-20131203/8670_1 /TAXON_ID=420275 /ORGANISM="Attheya septentrionalis, Strain CCMP2084" /LENGTH=912 /DNA_ID=CAMNT_0043989587 /DNA_START=393 /DNA_END=3131 /DNA_ORIENTATION=-